MRIATLSNAAVLHTQRWVAWFRSRGHQVKVWSLEPGPADLAAERLPRLPLPGALRYPLAAAALRRQLAHYQPDVVDAHYVPNYGVLGTLCGAKPLSVTAWGSDLLVAPRRDGFQAARARFVLARADLVIADSDNLAAAARALGAPSDRVHAIPWGIDLDRFRPAAAREPGLLVSTRMHEPVYDIASVIRGLAPLLERRPGTRLALAGVGSLTAALERLAARLLPAGRFAFLGTLAPAALAELLGRAELFVAASHSDSTSLSLLEAMASGAVPVVSDIDGNREWVADGDGARLFRPGDAEDLGRAAERALDPAWQEQARARNRREVERRADRNVNMRRIEALFESLASRGAPAQERPAGSTA